VAMRIRVETFLRVTRSFFFYVQNEHAVFFDVF